MCIKNSLDILNENEKRIYKNLEKNNFEKILIKDLAKQSFSSSAAIIRMAKKLGYSGFKEMLFQMKREKELKKNRYSISLKEEGMFFIKEKEAVDKFLSILNKNKILIYAEGFSEIISTYMYKKLLVLGRDVTLYHGIDYKMINKETLKNTSYKAVIIISKSGENQYCIKFAEYMKKHKLKLISFTGNGESSLSQISDIAFNYEDPYKEDRDIYYPNPFFGYTLVGFEKLIQLYFDKYID